MKSTKNIGFVIVILCLSSFITLFSILDTVFLWTDSAQQRWDISNPDASRMLAFSSAMGSVFILVFGIFLIHQILKEKDVLHFVRLLGWYFLLAGVAFGLLSGMGRQFHLDFFINAARGALLLIAVKVARKQN